MSYPSMLGQYLPQMGMLSSAPGMQGIGMPMANAAPQLPMGTGGGQGGMPFSPHLTGPQPPTPGGIQGGQGANPLMGILNNPAQMAMLKGLFSQGQGSQLPNGIGDPGAISVNDLMKNGSNLGWLSGLFGK